MINQEQFQRLQVLCNNILQNISVNNIEMAKQQSWLLHEIICTKCGENHGKKENAEKGKSQRQCSGKGFPFRPLPIKHRKKGIGNLLPKG